MSPQVLGATLDPQGPWFEFRVGVGGLPEFPEKSRKRLGIVPSGVLGLASQLFTEGADVFGLRSRDAGYRIVCRRSHRSSPV